MKRSFNRRFAIAALGLGALMGPTLLAATNADAAQAWYCICKGEKKRFLASTRHCEFTTNVPKGQWCTKAQTLAVYGPACAEKGCKIAPFE